MQWSKDDGSNSSFRKLIIPRLTHFEKLALSQFKVYIETETRTHCFVCCNCQKTILTWSSEGKERIFYILHMLSIHTGLQKLSKKNVYDVHLKKWIHLKSVNHALLLQGEKCYLKNIEWLLSEKYDIEFQNDDAIKRNQIFFDFMQWTFNCMDGLYIHEECILIDTIMKYQSINQSSAEI